MKILITGGCGFLGSIFVRHVACNHPDIQVFVLDSLTYAGNTGNLPAGFPNVDLVVGDICDHRVVDGLVLSADAVVNFAAETHNDNSINEPTPFLYSNVAGTFNLIEDVGNTMFAIIMFPPMKCLGTCRFRARNSSMNPRLINPQVLIVQLKRLLICW